MAVVNVTMFTVKPDRYDDLLDITRKTKALLEKHGGKNTRFMAALVAGEATGSFVFTYEADDFAAYGAVQDNFFADPEGQAVMSALGTGSSPIPGFQGTLWVDVPL